MQPPLDPRDPGWSFGSVIETKGEKLIVKMGKQTRQSFESYVFCYRTPLDPLFGDPFDDATASLTEDYPDDE